MPDAAVNDDCWLLIAADAIWGLARRMTYTADDGYAIFFAQDEMSIYGRHFGGLWLVPQKQYIFDNYFSR
jgi:hypothetical protein